MKKLNIALCTLALVATSGCATQTFQMQDSYGRLSQEKTQDFFVYGIKQEKSINAAKVCGGANKVVKVQSELTFINGLLGAITWGIYSPRDARVYCAK